MYGNKGEVPEDEDFTIPLGVADIKREGTDCTIVARSMMVPIALKAAEKIAEGMDVSCEVIDPRTIKPLDIDTIVESVKKTNRLVIAEESHLFCGVGAEISHADHGARVRLSRRSGQARLGRRSADAVRKESRRTGVAGRG